MSYATPTNVKSLFRDFADNADAAVSDTELQEFLDDAEEVINAKIGTLYQLPITVGENPKAFKVLRRLETFQVACIVDDILNSYGEADKKPQWCKKAKDLLNELVPPVKAGCRQCEPTMKLIDAVYLGTSTQRGRMSVQSTSEPVFKKGADNW